MINNYVNVERSVSEISVENNIQAFSVVAESDAACDLYISR